jgi:hypothetical protein
MAGNVAVKSSVPTVLTVPDGAVAVFSSIPTVLTVPPGGVVDVFSSIPTVLTAPHKKVQWVGVGAFISTTSGSGVTPAIPADAITDDTLVAVVRCEVAGTMAASAGWTKVYEDATTRLFWRTHTAGDSDPTFTLAGTNGYQARISAFRGASKTDPFLYGVEGNSTGTGTTATAPAIGVAALDGMAVQVYSHGGGTGYAVPLRGFPQWRSASASDGGGSLMLTTTDRTSGLDIPSSTAVESSAPWTALTFALYVPVATLIDGSGSATASGTGSLHARIPISGTGAAIASATGSVQAGRDDPGADLLHDLSQPYFGGEASGEPEGAAGEYLPVGLSGKGYMIDVTTQAYRRRHIDVYRTQQNPGEQMLLPPEVWRRTQESWHHGAGQERLDRETSLPYRYDSSHGVNPWQPWEVSMLKSTSLRQAVGSGTTNMVIVDHDKVFMSVNAGWWWWDDIDLAATTGAATSIVVDATTDGQALYTLHADATIRKWTTGDGGTLFATLTGTTPTMLEYVKGFLVAAVDNKLLDVTSGTPSTIYTSPLTGFRWIDGCEGLSVAYFMGGIGDKWMVHAAPIKEDATTLDPPQVACQLPEGEIGKALGSYLGYVLIGSDHGARFAVPATSGDLVYGQELDIDHSVLCFEGQSRFVWFGCGGDGLLHPSGCGGLGRMDLSVFTAPNTPAYAADLCGGVSGDVVAVGTVEATSISARRAFVIAGVGLYVESPTDLTSTGYIEMSRINFGITDNKIALYAQVSHDPLNGSLTWESSADEEGYAGPVTNAIGGTVRFGNIPVSTEPFSLLQQRITFGRDVLAPSEGPELTRVEFRAIPSVGQASEWTIPLMIEPILEWQGAIDVRDPQADLDFLLSLVQSSKSFELREGDRRYTVHATGFEWRPREMTEDESAWRGVFIINVRELA